MKIFITGGTTGIGLELTKSYLKDGHSVGICGRSMGKLPKGFREEHKNLKCYELDVSKRDQVYQAIMNFSNSSSENLDLLIANAGIGIGDKSLDMSFSQARDMININVIGVLNSFEAGLELMKKQKNGHLVAVASIAGMVGLPGASAYCASKAAVLALCESMAIDLKSTKISVTAIAPGFIDTPLVAANNHLMPFIMPAKKGAEKIKRAIQKKKVLYIFPWPMKLLMIMLQKMPRFLYRTIMTMDALGYKEAKKIS